MEQFMQDPLLTFFVFLLLFSSLVVSIGHYQEEKIPKLVKKELQVSTTYPVKEIENVKYIFIPVKTSITNAFQNISCNIELEMTHHEKKLEGNNVVETGAIIRTKEEKEEIYIVVAKGDINGDGKVEFTSDVVRLNNYRLKRIALETANRLAGDIDENGEIDFIKDIVKMNNFRLNRIQRLS